MNNVYETYSKKYFQTGGELYGVDYFILFVCLVICIICIVAAVNTQKQIDDGNKSTLKVANLVMFIFFAVLFGCVFLVIIAAKTIA
jgi:uncharacterized membrane protein YhaH (DUF805 family)